MGTVPVADVVSVDAEAMMVLLVNSTACPFWIVLAINRIKIGKREHELFNDGRFDAEFWLGSYLSLEYVREPVPI